MAALLLRRSAFSTKPKYSGRGCGSIFGKLTPCTHCHLKQGCAATVSLRPRCAACTCGGLGGARSKIDSSRMLTGSAGSGLSSGFAAILCVRAGRLQFMSVHTAGMLVIWSQGSAAIDRAGTVCSYFHIPASSLGGAAYLLEKCSGL